MFDLVWNEVLSLSKTIRFYTLFLVVYLGLALMGVVPISVATAVAEFILLILPISAVFHDEQTGWDRFAQAAPLLRRKMVGARYLFTLLLLLFAAAIGLLVCVLLSITATLQRMEAQLALVLTCLDVGLVAVSILLPLCYKLGPERARPCLYAVLLLPVIPFFFAHPLNLPDLPVLSGTKLTPACFFGLVLCLSGLFLSYLLSCRVVASKQF